jgi:hypothetical protein
LRNEPIEPWMMNRRAWLRLSGAALAGAVMWGARQSRADASSSLTFAELYQAQTVRGLELSTKSRALGGKPVKMLGYMAPPLKPEVEFFVLTRAPVALCPFCNSDADWPSDIVVVYPRDRTRWSQDGLPVAVSGILELGPKVDGKTGFVSLVRVVDADVTTLR